MSTSSMLPRLATLKNVSLPTEHGGWGFLLEPMLLGMLLTPSWAGAWLCLAGLGAFLTRRPFMLAVGDLRYGHRYPRTGTAMGVALLLGAGSLAGMAKALQAAGWPMVVPLLLAVPLAAIFLYYDAARHARTLTGELSGALAMGVLAPAILAGGGWSLASAMGAWVLLGARAVTSIVYVRAQVRRLHGQGASFGPVLVIHTMVLAMVTVAAWHSQVPYLASLPFALMLARSWHGARNAPASARVLGWNEMKLGLVTVLLVVVGYALHL